MKISTFQKQVWFRFSALLVALTLLTEQTAVPARIPGEPRPTRVSTVPLFAGFGSLAPEAGARRSELVRAMNDAFIERRLKPFLDRKNSTAGFGDVGKAQPILRERTEPGTAPARGFGAAFDDRPNEEQKAPGEVSSALPRLYKKRGGSRPGRRACDGGPLRLYGQRKSSIGQIFDFFRRRPGDRWFSRHDIAGGLQLARSTTVWAQLKHPAQLGLLEKEGKGSHTHYRSKPLGPEPASAVRRILEDEYVFADVRKQNPHHARLRIASARDLPVRFPATFGATRRVTCGPGLSGFLSLAGRVFFMQTRILFAPPGLKRLPRTIRIRSSFRNISGMRLQNINTA